MAETIKQKRRRLRWLREGRCSRCGEDLESKVFSTCQVCRDLLAYYKRESKRKRLTK